jgi:hypothetical protein
MKFFNLNKFVALTPKLMASPLEKSKKGYNRENDE